MTVGETLAKIERLNADTERLNRSTERYNRWTSRLLVVLAILQIANVVVILMRYGAK